MSARETCLSSRKKGPKRQIKIENEKKMNLRQICLREKQQFNQILFWLIFIWKSISLFFDGIFPDK